MSAAQRIALVIEYDGGGFNGWQAQTASGDVGSGTGGNERAGIDIGDNAGNGAGGAGGNGERGDNDIGGDAGNGGKDAGGNKNAVVTVQETLEAALSKVAAAPVRVVCAGRTDAGVHASHQVVHFDSPNPRPERAWLLGANAALPRTVAVRAAREVGGDFHARFSAAARRYRYLICNAPTRPAIARRYAAWVRAPLDAPRMHRAAQCLLGEHDFSAFRAAACQSRTPMRRMDCLEASRRGEFIAVEAEANAFLLRMVRNIVGSLIQIGSGQAPEHRLAELLHSRDRTQAPPTAPPEGLCLIGVQYPPAFNIPATTASHALYSAGFSE